MCTAVLRALAHVPAAREAVEGAGGVVGLELDGGAHPERARPWIERASRGLGAREDPRSRRGAARLTGAGSEQLLAAQEFAAKLES